MAMRSTKDIRTMVDNVRSGSHNTQHQMHNSSKAQ